MLRTMIIDDETDSILFLSQALKAFCPFVSLVGTATTVEDGIGGIVSNRPDLVLLDVEMSPGTGFDILDKLTERNFEVIFITAHNDYAIQAFRHSAVDYILKPVDIRELVQAINKVNQSVSRNHLMNFNVLLENIRTEIPNKLAIPTSNGYEYINVDDIIRLEADRSYCNFYLAEKRKIMVSKCLNDFQQKLDVRKFFRAHHSYLINLAHVKSFTRKDGGYVEMTDGSHIPIARRKKDFFVEAMKKFAV
jgi:two-component system LytT family response regulator